MVHYFREHAYDEEMARHVRPRNAPKSFDSFKGVSLKQMGASIQSLDSISAIVSGFEKDNKGVPILLRHYLRLNGVLLNFNVDPAFNDVIDGLILVDLCKADPNILQRYMDKQGHGEFMKFHGFGPDVADS